MTTSNEYISDFKMPLRFLDRINSAAAAAEVKDISSQLREDMLSVEPSVFISGAATSTLSKVIYNIGLVHSVSSLDALNDDNFLLVQAESSQDKEFYAEVQLRSDIFCARIHAYRIYLTRSTRALSANHSVEDMTVCDLLAVLACMKQSQHGKYLLVRYNDMSMMANPLFAGSSYIQGSEASPVGDMWKMFGGILSELRSVIFDLSDCSVASLPFYKFRNYGECEAYMPDAVAKRISSASYVEFTDKMDGSFLQMKYVGSSLSANYNGDMLVSTSGSLIEEQSEHIPAVKAAITKDEQDGYDYVGMCQDNTNTTFMFEFIFPEVDAHIVQYPESEWGIYLLSARDINTGHVWTRAELESVADKYGMRIAKYFDGMSLDDVLSICSTAMVSDREGFVVNIDGFLVKLKLDQFCSISKLVHNANNFNTIAKVVVGGYLDDLVAKLPAPYQPAVIEDAARLSMFVERMRAYIEYAALEGGFGVGISDDTSVNMKDVAAYVQGKVSKSFRSFVMNYIKYGEHPGNYLLSAPQRKNSNCIKEKDFDRLSGELEALGF